MRFRSNVFATLGLKRREAEKEWPNYSEDQQRALVVEGLKLEVPIDQIAEDLELTVEYVHAIAVNAGYRAAIF